MVANIEFRESLAMGSFILTLPNQIGLVTIIEPQHADDLGI